MAYIYQYAKECAFSLFKSLFVYTPTIEYKKVAIPQKLRTDVWRKYHNDSFIGTCYACGCALDYCRTWHCSHVLAESKGGELTLENLRPCCVKCNLSMGNMNLYSYISKNNLQGPGKNQVKKYFKAHPSQLTDTRTKRK